jgi:hypothetical protein
LEFRCLGDFFVHLTEISSLTHLNDFWDEVQLLVSGLIHLQGFEILLVASGVVQVLLLLPAAGGTKVRESEYGRP